MSVVFAVICAIHFMLRRFSICQVRRDILPVEMLAATIPIILFLWASLTLSKAAFRSISTCPNMSYSYD